MPQLGGISGIESLRLVYCVRLTERKGVDRSLQIITRAAALGAALSGLLMRLKGTIKFHDCRINAHHFTSDWPMGMS
jgi:hypothetical protein